MRPTLANPNKFEEAVRFHSTDPPKHLKELMKVRSSTADVTVNYEANSASNPLG